ncbi:MAG TPA: MBL fold metallo-hydrolase [Ktedonobacterales bacterium]|jgi:glyoxylase-like metal-dependent hydrolase (beta-lactamase superfamily II)
MPLPAGILTLLAPNPSLMTGAGTNTYIVRGDEDECVVIDPGMDDAGHLDHIVRAAGTQRIARILITHGHEDHRGGAAQLRERTGAPVLAWSREGTPEADATLADGAIIPIGTVVLRALHTPGHRFDHLCFLHEARGALFAGDLVAGVGTVVIAPPEGDMADYLASLERLLALPRLGAILPAHGPIIKDGPALLRQYIAHRLERERQVLAALAAGDTTLDALVARIYAAVDPALHPVAARTVLAHLLKLERTGAARRGPGSDEAGPWRLAPPAGQAGG